MGKEFDEIAKALGGGMSRGQALRRVLGGVIAAAAATLPGNAFASGWTHGNAACVGFCNSVFGVGTPGADECIEDSAHRTGICYACGPKATGIDHVLCGQVCCPRGYCYNLNGGSPICLALNGVN